MIICIGNSIEKSADKEIKPLETKAVDLLTPQEGLNGQIRALKDEKRAMEMQLKEEIAAQKYTIHQLNERLGEHETSSQDTSLLEKIDEIFNALPTLVSRSPQKSNLSKLDIIRKYIIESNSHAKEKTRLIPPEHTQTSPNKTSISR